MKADLKKYTLLFVVSIISYSLNAQDTTRYEGLIQIKPKLFILLETIELYSDSTFQWTSKYDLSWSEYGVYQIKDNILTLNFIAIDSNENLKTNKIKKYEIGKNNLYKLNDKGHRIKTIKDKSIRTKWSWLLGHTYKYKIHKKSK